MRISFSPQRRDDLAAPVASVSGDVITINGTAFDFSTLAEGDFIEMGAVPCPWIAGAVKRIDGEVRLALVLPCGIDPSPELAFPEPVTLADGLVSMPR